jgi:FkbM family methyltransferase
MTEFELYKKYFKAGFIVYDIGAHIGEHSIHLAKLGAKHVYAFEPSNRNFGELMEKTKQFSTISNYEVALNTESYECVTRFRDCSDARKAVEQDGEQPIKYIVLQDFIKGNNIPLPDFVKMDIEGMESLALNTFEFLFKSSRPIISLEVHVAPKGERQNYKDNPHWKYPNEGGFDFNKLKEHNYLMLNDNAKEIQGDYNPAPMTHAHVMLVPKEKI